MSCAPVFRPKLGTEVFYSHALVRTCGPGGGNERRWVAMELDHELRGVYVGMRTVYDGWVSPWSEDEAAAFHVERAVVHALVLAGERENPIRVLYEHVREVP